MFKNLFNKGNNESTSNSVEKVAQEKFSYYNYITEEMKSPEYVFDAEEVLEGLDEDEIDGWHGVEVERVTYQLMTQYAKEGVNIQDNYWDIKTEAENQVNPVFQQYKMAHSLELNGFVASGFAQEDSNNPFLAPIHGVDLKKYTAIGLKLIAGIPEETVLKAVNIDPVIWQEINEKWIQRMSEDTTYTVTSLYGQYFAEKPTLPELEHLQAEQTEEGKANLLRLQEDAYYYYELTGARQAAYDYGLDGAQWIMDNFGISLGDFQSVAMQYMEERNKNFSSADITHYLNYQDEKEKEYAAKFAEEQGGNIADDVEF